MPLEIPQQTVETASRLPLEGWALDLARRWNSGSYSMFVLHGNIYDMFPIQDGERVEYLSLKAFLSRRMFPRRDALLFYDIGDGLTFGSADMQKQFFQWLEVYDKVEDTNFHQDGPPRDFTTLAPLLRRFFMRTADNPEDRRGVTLIIDYPEKIIPAADDAGASQDERKALVTLLKWAASPDFRAQDVGVLLITETAAELQADLLQNPHVAHIRIDLPGTEERRRFLASGWVEDLGSGSSFEALCGIPAEDLANRLAGLNLLRIQHLIAEAVRNGRQVTPEHIAAGKKRLIEEYCQGLVRFKDPKPGLNLDIVATHTAAKKKLRDIAWLIKNGKTDVLERGILLPGRVGVGKSFLIDCFAGDCGLPVMEIGDFRSKWVGDTERQQSRILMTIRALGPVIVVVDEADAVFGNRSDDGDSGVSSRVFAAFAAHIGDSALRGREVWVAMTSRPDLLAIDMKRQGRFGLCIPLFPAQTPDEVMELFTVIARTRKIALAKPVMNYIHKTLGVRALTGSDVESMLMRAKECAVLAGRDTEVSKEDVEQAVDSFIDPLDPNLLELQEIAAVLACSDRRYLPERHAITDRGDLMDRFSKLKSQIRR